MLLGAVIDAGASIERVQDAVDRLGMGATRVAWGRVRRAGVAAVTVRIRPPEDTASPDAWAAVRSILEDAGLTDAVRDRAQAVFRRLVEAEAAATGVAVDAVRLAPYGTLDALGHVVGTCAGVVDLGIGRLTVGPVGIGTTDPDDAVVAALLRGHRLVGTGVVGGLVTRTGAALVAGLAAPVAAAPGDAPARVGTGAGERDLGHPHVLRLLLEGPGEGGLELGGG